jgi:hypothetical protein
MADHESRSEVDRLYWETDTSVADIADQLEISRRALYDAIQPRPIGVACVECGGDLVFRNRSAADRRQAECLGCANEVVVERVPDEDSVEPEVEQERSAARISPLSRKPLPQPGHAAGLGASLLTGLALGAVAGYLLRHR